MIDSWINSLRIVIGRFAADQPIFFGLMALAAMVGLGVLFGRAYGPEVRRSALRALPVALPVGIGVALAAAVPLAPIGGALFLVVPALAISLCGSICYGNAYVDQNPGFHPNQSKVVRVFLAVRSKRMWVDPDQPLLLLLACVCSVVWMFFVAWAFQG